MLFLKLAFVHGAYPWNTVCEVEIHPGNAMTTKLQLMSVNQLRRNTEHFFIVMNKRCVRVCACVPRHITVFVPYLS